MTALCVVPRCSAPTGGPREAGHGRWACAECVRDIRTRLRHIETYAGMLPHLMRPGRGGDDTRRAPGFGSRSPARLDVVVARDIRSRVDAVGPDDDRQPTWPILGTLHRWARWIRDDQDVSAPRVVTLTSEVGYLISCAEWCSHRPWVGDPFAAFAELHAQCRRLARDQPGRPIGHCKTLLPTGECGTPLFVPTVGDSVVCSGCHQRWPRSRWEWLARLLNDRARVAS